MKRRLANLASSTSKVKKSWREETAEDDESNSNDRPMPDSDEDSLPKAKAPVTKPDAEVSGDGDWDALEAALDGKSGLNPVVWMDVSVADKPRGRLHFELFKDVVPKAASNFERLCRGVRDEQSDSEARVRGYRGTELHKVVPHQLLEGGDFDQSATGKDFEDESFSLVHSKPGLLTMANDGPNTNTSRFQVTFEPLPHLDGRQVVFGQVLPSGDPGTLHPLHWVRSVGTPSGDTRELVVIADCGVCSPEEVRTLPVPPPPFDLNITLESQESRYARSGQVVSRLEDAVTAENAEEALQLADEALEAQKASAKKAKDATGEHRRRLAEEIEVRLKSVALVLEAAERLGAEAQARQAKEQLADLKELEEKILRMY